MADKKMSIPDPLKDQIRKFIKDDELFEAARKDDLHVRVEKAFRNDLEKRSYQGPAGIEEALKLVGYPGILHQVAMNSRSNEDQLRTDLERHTKRRHSIAHRGDYDMEQNPPVEKPIKKKDAEDCIKMVKLIAHHIHIIVRKDA